MSRRGQALVETCLVMVLLCLLLLGVLQVSLVYLAGETLDHAAACGARAAAVGFNDFMVYKTVRVASIPTAGALTQPAGSAGAGLGWGTTRIGQLWDQALSAAPASAQLDTERTRIPLYLAARDYGDLGAILAYADWRSVHDPALILGDWQAAVRTRQDLPLRLAMHRAFYGADTVTLDGAATLDHHAALYLEP